MLKDVQKSALLSIFNREISKINKFPSQKTFFLQPNFKFNMVNHKQSLI